MKHNSSKRLQLNNHELHLCHTVSTELSASNVTSQMLCCTEERNRNVSWRDQDEPHQATMPGGLLGINSFESQHTSHSPGITAHAFWSQGQLLILISIKSLMVRCHFAVSSCHCLLKHTEIRMMDFTKLHWTHHDDVTFAQSSFLLNSTWTYHDVTQYNLHPKQKKGTKSLIKCSLLAHLV